MPMCLGMHSPPSLNAIPPQLQGQLGQRWRSLMLCDGTSAGLFLPNEHTVGTDRPMPPPADTPFSRLGVHAAFPPDTAAIERAWLTASARLHPDRAADPAQAARELSRINEAREILVDPERCANALLQHMGGPAAEEDKALPDGLLMDMLEARDRLEESRGNADALAKIDTWARTRRDEHIARITELFATATGPERLHDIRVELNAWRYVERFIEQLAE